MRLKHAGHVLPPDDVKIFPHNLQANRAIKIPPRSHQIFFVLKFAANTLRSSFRIFVVIVLQKMTAVLGKNERKALVENEAYFSLHISSHAFLLAGKS
jgi:hypothetical protein